MPHLTLPAPAKLNLFLHIVGRRPDGYHELQTLFQFLDYGDELTFEPRDDDQIRIEPALPGVSLENNLIWKAAAQLRKEAGSTLPGYTIHCDKRLPMGGGLGGGSSNAATTLVALNVLWDLKIPVDRLAEIGLSLGADVPVFVRGHSAWAEGVGERLTPLSPPEDWYLILKPECEVSTALIFGHEGLTRHSPRIKIAPAFEGDDPRYRNDCQSLVCELYPEVARALDWLGQYTSAKLTGTGACIFGRFPTESEALEILARKPSGIKGFVAKAVNLSPLTVRLNELN